MVESLPKGRDDTKAILRRESMKSNLQKRGHEHKESPLTMMNIYKDIFVYVLDIGINGDRFGIWCVKVLNTS